MTSRKLIERRTFLRGTVAGGLTVSIGLPLLEAMLNQSGTALAQNQPLPKRFGVFFWGNGRGVDVARWRPATSGAGWMPSPQLEPLAPVKDYVSVLTGMTARQNKSPQGHHNGSVSILSGYDFVTQEKGNAPYRSTFARPSIDQLAAATLGTTTRFKSIEVGISRRVITGEGTTIQYISHKGPDSGNPPEVNAKALFDRLFSGAAAKPATPATPTAPAMSDALGALKKSVLDTVLEDLNALGKRVGAADKARLEQHAESIRAVERRLASAPAGVVGGAVGGPQCDMAKAPVDPPGSNNKEPIEERMVVMSDLLALALSCDVSRVFSIQFSGSAAGPVFWQVGATRGHHDMSHDGQATQSIIDACTIFTMKQLAVLLKKFKDTPDGAGNLLDSLALIASSDSSNGATHTVEDMPVLIAGKAGGALVHPGVHYASNKEHTNRVLLTLLRSVGVQIAELGEGNVRQTEGLSALQKT
jgi:hypothetical protein